MKTCPFCAEEIQEAAIVCKHCGRDLPGTQPVKPELPAWEKEARALAAGGNKVAAIKIVRERGGGSLADAKTLVESWPGPNRDVPTAAAKKTGCATWLVVIVLGLMVVGYFAGPSAPTEPSSASAPARPSPERNATPTKAPEPVLEILSKTGRPTASGSYYEVEGQVKNLSGVSLENIQVIATWYTKDGTFITSDSALIEYNPLLPGQTSPFKTLTRGNPEMSRFSVEFKPMFGATLLVKDSDK